MHSLWHGNVWAPPARACETREDRRHGVFSASVILGDTLRICALRPCNNLVDDFSDFRLDPDLAPLGIYLAEIKIFGAVRIEELEDRCGDPRRRSDRGARGRAVVGITVAAFHSKRGGAPPWTMVKIGDGAPQEGEMIHGAVVAGTVILTDPIRRRYQPGRR